MLVSNIGTIRYQIFDIVASCGVIVYIINASVKMFILLVLCSLVLLFINKKTRDLYEKRYKERREARENQSSTFTELIRGIRDIKVLNLRKIMTERIIEGQKKVNEISYKEHKEQDMFGILYTCFRQLITVIVIVYSLYLLSNNEIDGSLLLVIFMYHNRIIYLTTSIGEFYKIIKE